MTVNIAPLPTWARQRKYKPQFPPIFPDGDPTHDDLELALALFAELDSESRAWYGPGFADRLHARLSLTANR